MMMHNEYENYNNEDLSIEEQEKDQNIFEITQSIFGN